MLKTIMAATVALSVFGTAAFAQAIAPDSPAAGARAGNSYVPSTYTPGCKGILCNEGADPRVLQGPPPPCEGLICGMTPYSMAPPMTASEARRMQEERARAEAAAAAPPMPAKPAKRARRHAKAKVKAKSVAARTPDTSAAPPQPQ